MPIETDPSRLELLARVLQGAIGEVLFDLRAFTGSAAEPDDIGLFAVLGAGAVEEASRVRLRDALVAFLRRGGAPNRVDVAGSNWVNKDPETRYEFRISLNRVKVYVKTVADFDDPRDPTLTVKCVKKQN